ncbi:methyltransferase type 11 [Apiospora rasikravindrae]|uniref:Methyltransferase type 11 n=1 Tax=Apiospora rasikravindrae TaxID=990691 RepID=A0ABR1T9U7_9PEZI
MANQSLSTKVEDFMDKDIFGGASNDEVLSQLRNVGPSPANRIPHVYQLPKEELEYTSPWPRGPRIRASTFTTLVRLHEPLHRGLPPAISQSHVYDVFVVSLPNLKFRVLSRSSEHWSVFCNGHYYHLKSISRSTDAPIHTAHVDKDADKPSSQFEDVDPSNPNLAGYSTLSDMSGKQFLAYHMGQTSYSSPEIRQIAEWIIGRLDQYGFLASECEHFVLCLLLRIVNRGRVRRQFLGTDLQIADWARGLPKLSRSECDGVSGGLELMRPDDPIDNSTFPRRHYLNWKIGSLTRHPQLLRTSGPRALIANPLLPYNAPRDLCCDFSADAVTSQRSHTIQLGGELALNANPSPRQWRSNLECVDGFSLHDILWARRRDKDQDLENWLAPGVHNRALRYHVGVAYLEPKGHAAVILQNGRSNEVARFETTYRYYEYDALPAAGARLLHVRFLPGRRDAFALVLSQPLPRNLRFIRYHDLYRVHTTERTIRHLALRACPSSHQYITSDCATYAFNFLGELLGHLAKQCARSSIQPHVDYLALHNHVQEGSLGALEAAIRWQAHKHHGRGDEAATGYSIPSGTVGAIGAVAPVAAIMAGVDEPWRLTC